MDEVKNRLTDFMKNMDERFEAMEEKIDKQVDEIINIFSRKLEESQTKLQQVFEDKLAEINDKIDHNANSISKYRIEMLQIIEGRAMPMDTKLKYAQDDIEQNKAVIASINVKIEEIKKELLRLNKLGNEGKNLNEVSGSRIFYADLGKKIPSFGNKKKDEHPIQFLKSLEVYMMRWGVPEGLKVPTSIECLEGDVRVWAERHSGEWGNFEDFKSAFKEQFWAQKIQNKIRLRIHEQRSYKVNQGTMSHHVWGWIKSTQHLTPAMSEESFIGAVSKHFSCEVEMHLLTARIKTINEFVDIVQDIEEINCGSVQGMN